jgi:hypothetical protein
MSATMNGSDDFADLERRLVADANRLHERTVEFVDSNKLAREGRARRTRVQAVGAGVFIVVALTLATVTRTETNNPRPAAVSNLDQPRAVIEPNAASPQVISQTQTPSIASDPKVVKSKTDASHVMTTANTPLRPLEFVVTVPDGEGRRAIGRIYCLPVPNDQPPSPGQSPLPVFLTTRRRIKFNELSFVQQDAVRRLLGMEQPVAASVTF